MLKHVSFLILLLLLLVINAGNLFAGEIVTSEDVVLEEAINDNYYIAGSNVKIEVDILKDLNVAGNNVFINGDVLGDLHVAGKNVVIRGDVKQDLMILSGSVELHGSIGGDILVFGGKVNIFEDAIISGDSIIMGGELIHNGNLTGNLNTITGNVNLNGYVGGNSVLTTQSLFVGGFFDTPDDSSVSYFSPKEAEITEGIESNFSYNRTKEWRESRLVQSNLSSFFGFLSILRFITTLVMIYLIMQLFKPFTRTVVNFGDKKWITALVIGLIVTIAIPAISILLMVSLIGLPFGIILLTVFSIVFMIRVAVASMIVGGWLRELYEKKRSIDHKYSNFFFSIIGLILLSLIKLIPYVGETVYIVIYLIAIGAVMHYLYKTVFKIVK